MKDQKRKKMLGTMGAVLILFATESRGSWDSFSGNAYNSVYSSYIGENGAESALTDFDYSFLTLQPIASSMPLHGYKSFNTAEQYIQGEQDTEEPGVSKSAFNEVNSNDQALREGHQIDVLDLDSIEVDRNSSIYDLSKPIDAFVDMYHLPALSVEEPGASSTLSAPAEPTISALYLKARKRKKDEIDAIAPQIVMAPSTKKEKKEEVLEEEDIQDITDEQWGSVDIAKKERKVEDLEIRLWNDKRLTNMRRISYKTLHQTVYKYESNDFVFYLPCEIRYKTHQENIKKDIENYCRKVAPLIEKNALWYFIASRSRNTASKCRDLLGLEELFKDESADEHKKMVMGLTGYYSGVFEDMLKYMEKHRALKTSKEYSLTVWKETLGDIYIRKRPEINYCLVEGQEAIRQMNRKYSALGYAVRMILTLPEVYQDFFNIKLKFIKSTRIYRDVYKNGQAHLLLLSMHALVREVIEDNARIEKEYENIYCALEGIYKKDAQNKSTAARIYKQLYAVLADFYDKAKVFDANEYVLAGKCVIKNQTYIKCKATLGAVLDKGAYSIRVYRSIYSFETNRWDISPDVDAHYHVYYVDNTTHQLRKLCMPIYKEEGKREEYYLHSIESIIKHIKMLYKIELTSDCVHPFKVRRETREWTYIRRGDRKMTVKELKEYEVVFYYIEEDLKETKFTFAELRPLKANKNSICIPLFLTPLMQSAVELGPFTKERVHAELDSIELENRVPSVYIYDLAYIGSEYSDMHGYYSNLYIHPKGESKRNSECYAMGYKTEKQPDNSMKVEWCARMPSSVDEYTHYVLDRGFREEENERKFYSFVNALESREHSRDSELHGIWLRSSRRENSQTEGLAQKIYTWQVTLQMNAYKRQRLDVEEIQKRIRDTEEKFKNAKEKYTRLGLLANSAEEAEKKNARNLVSIIKSRTRKRLEVLHKELYKKMSEKPDEQAEFIVVRNVNSSKSNLGAHNEILDIFISHYNRQKKVSEE
ncbi:hypothetical protein NEMIN01_0251 [Nematocida minor]|uniref:uncharacterized protein n=1 Tax=Nematocida minor TaxID=1912983 RepID=UPI0022210C50|nr:uncharacterized protein NEMIN01_0251 [Nematocida minor]KAI5188987.1 hypothetical protein NEMIN01_0251 [Nematocida minor]